MPNQLISEPMAHANIRAYGRREDQHAKPVDIRAYGPREQGAPEAGLLGRQQQLQSLSAVHAHHSRPSHGGAR